MQNPKLYFLLGWNTDFTGCILNPRMVNKLTVSTTLRSHELKVSSRVKNHHFTKFAIFRWLNRAHQELSFKKVPGKMFFLCILMESKSFFYANYFN